MNKINNQDNHLEKDKEKKRIDNLNAEPINKLIEWYKFPTTPYNCTSTEEMGILIQEIRDSTHDGFYVNSHGGGRSYYYGCVNTPEEARVLIKNNLNKQAQELKEKLQDKIKHLDDLVVNPLEYFKVETLRGE
ncbi:MAG: hypothetical protein ACP5N2_01585 [Candidatus Nanoarchaeia archaeon]